MTIQEIKQKQMLQLAEYRKHLYENPVLRFLFLELTLRCNEHCLHCGSNCGNEKSEELTLSEYKEILNDIKRDFDTTQFQLCITGGEPLLRSDFFEIMSYANELGYNWGMTSNATLITKEVAQKLYDCGMKTISVSIDGLPETHNQFRQIPNAYEKAIDGIQNLIDIGKFRHIQITSVMNHSNLHELDEMLQAFTQLNIDSWRIIGIEPIGRALQHPELLLTQEDQTYLMDFIRNKRMEQLPTTYGCSHFLGYKYEREVRDHYFLCNAGIYAASICANGDIMACLDIERRPEFIQGNIKNDNFKDVWENRFQIFRHPLSDLDKNCNTCEYMNICAGGSRHSFDYDTNKQRICFRGSLCKEI